MRAAIYYAFSALTALIVPNVARATPTFPDVLAAYVPMPFSPSCSLCHAGAETRGSVTSPFGAKMRMRGLVADDEDSLRRAIDAFRAEGIDSDADGVTDVDELSAGEDPNTAGDAYVPDLQYGCGNEVAHGRSAPGPTLSIFALVALFILRRRAK